MRPTNPAVIQGTNDQLIASDFNPTTVQSVTPVNSESTSLEGTMAVPSEGAVEPSDGEIEPSEAAIESGNENTALIRAFHGVQPVRGSSLIEKESDNGQLNIIFFFRIIFFFKVFPKSYIILDH